MSRQEDFEKAAMDYCEDHSHCIYFEFGAEHGYQYAQTHPNWISVEDELPKEKGAYLFHFDDGQTRVEGYFPELHLSKCVTHWMPIVPPRKEE